MTCIFVLMMLLLFADDTNLFVSGQSIDEVTAIANMCKVS